MQNGFGVERTRLEYRYYFSPNWSSRLALETKNIGSKATGYENLAYLRFARVQYKKNGLTVKGGLIGTQFAKLQETLNQHRYLIKAFNDEYKFGSTNEFGVEAQYQLLNFLKLDIAVFNGEGYKTVQQDSAYRYAFGATFHNDAGLYVRAYSNIETLDTASVIFLGLIGYKNEKMSAHIEFNSKSNEKGRNNHNRFGTSLCLTYKLSEKCKLLARHDYLSSNTLEGDSENWYIDKDGQLLMLAFEYAPTTGIKLTPNFRGWQNDKTDKLTAVGMLNLELKF